MSSIIKPNIMDLQNMKVAEVQLSYKTKVNAKDRPKINTSEDVNRLLKENWNYEIRAYRRVQDHSPE